LRFSFWPSIHQADDLSSIINGKAVGLWIATCLLNNSAAIPQRFGFQAPFFHVTVAHLHDGNHRAEMPHMRQIFAPGANTGFGHRRQFTHST
jgi:hypothetical protein